VLVMLCIPWWVCCNCFLQRGPAVRVHEAHNRNPPCLAFLKTVGLYVLMGFLVLLIAGPADMRIVVISTVLGNCSCYENSR
jgi:hypothetical protein